MTSIMNCLKIELTLMHRSKWFYAVVVLSLVYFGYRAYGEISSNNPGEAINFTSYVVQAGIFLFLICGVLLTRAETNGDAHEIFLTIPHGFRNKIIGKVLYLFLIVLFYCGCSFLLLAIMYQTIDTPAPFYYNAFLYMVLYWILPFTISGVLGIVAGVVFKSKVVYPILIVMGILLGPLNTIVFISLTRTLPPLLGNIMATMNLGQSDPFRAYHIVYGFPIETFRWITKGLVLIISLLLLFLVSSIRIRYRRLYLAHVGVSLSLIAVLTMVWNVFAPHLDELTSKQAIKSDNTYYAAYNQKSIEINESFEVNRYIMDLSIKNQLKNVVTMSIMSSRSSSQLSFALYHNLVVTNVRWNNQELPFHQEGDTFTIRFPETLLPSTPYEVTVTYQGKTPQRFFANEQAVMLPGYLIWYPVPYTQPIAEYVDKRMVRYYSYPFTNKPNYELHYTGPGKLYSNLIEQTDGTWTGTSSSGITLISGAMEKIVVGDVEIIRPYALYRLSNDLTRDITEIEKMNKEISLLMDSVYKPIQKLFLLETRMTTYTLRLEDQLAIMDVNIMNNNDLSLSMNETLIQYLIAGNVRNFDWERQDENMKDLYTYALSYWITQKNKMMDKDKTYLSGHYSHTVKSFYSDYDATFQRLLRFLDENGSDVTVLKPFFRDWLDQLQETIKVNWDYIEQLLLRYERKGSHAGTSNK